MCASINIWRDSVVYDELTINESQKSDKGFSMLLDCVRRGCPRDETLSTLKQRVIQVSVLDKLNEPKESGWTPVCLFPTRVQCDDLNSQMLNCLPSKVKVIECTDDIDQTSTTRKWTKKATEHLEKLNKDCNITAGLEANLHLAVGARVMLRRNIDTENGLVNGAIGTVQKISIIAVTVKFDHIDKPYEVEKVKSRFMVLRNFYVYRKQFPLILAYAVTIHKCQGLSLDCAVVDLSEKVFSAGMAYVALSRVRSLSGLYLSTFDPNSLIASPSCISEVNRLREAYRKDLPLYDMPRQTKTRATKRKLTGEVDVPKARKLVKLATKTLVKKQQNESQPSAPDGEDTDSEFPRDPRDYQPREQRVWPFSYHPVNEHWQIGACAAMGLRYVCANGVSAGGPAVPLRRPNLTTLKNTRGDGNCMFRALSYLITGTQAQHLGERAAIVRHLLQYDDLFMCSAQVGVNVNYNSLSEYIIGKQMDNNKEWGTEVELFAICHLLRTKVYIHTHRLEVPGNFMHPVTLTPLYMHWKAVLIWKCLFTMHLIITRMCAQF